MECITENTMRQVENGHKIPLSKANFTDINEVLSRIDKDLYVATTLLTKDTYHIKSKLYELEDKELNYRLTNVRTLASRIQILTNAFQMLKRQI